MTHLTTENLIATCECFLRLHRPTWAEIMGTIGAGPSTAFGWRARCKKDMADDLKTTSPFYFRWREIDDWWINHVERAISEIGLALIQQVKAQAIGGIVHPVRGPDQRILYKLNPLYISRDDEYVRISEGLDADADVEWHRMEHDEHGHPIPETRVEQLPSALRLRVLEVIDPAFRPSQNVDVTARMQVVHTAAPLQRRPDDVKPKDIPELRRLALMSPEQRRAELKASAFPKNEKGLVVRANTGAGRVLGQRSDHIREQQPIAPPLNPRAYQAPLNPAEGAPKPSYAKPNQSLDQSSRGRGVPPSGGFKVA